MSTFEKQTDVLAPIAALFELISGDFGGGFAAAKIPGNSECGKREIATEYW
ncbi:hypothetical protein [Chryseobacterium sp. YIM B08800]|uniref:hypothetical protein n=1 Tax=Chryseobacterium sp. YIM B08800 TaxID=2984136 RepID=UPI00224081E8|nr:hypothetical protein [Chryseobacterium sp. YIM B08800]